MDGPGIIRLDQGEGAGMAREVGWGWLEDGRTMIRLDQGTSTNCFRGWLGYSEPERRVEQDGDAGKV